MTDEILNEEEHSAYEAEIVSEASKREYEVHKQDVADRLRSQIEFAQALLKSLLLVNGAALISLLTFIGNSKSSLDTNQIWWSFSSFGLGVFLSLTAYFAAFFSQINFMHVSSLQMWFAHFRSHGVVPEVAAAETDAKKHLQRGECAMNLGIVFAFLSLLTFIIGMFLALEAIL